ncbi:hypothetical protein DITRI_Ditri09bG0032900 [Diplodiscus trichospermus]
MAKPRVTITLGGSGKVEKMRDGAMVDQRRMSGSKRFLQNKSWSNGSAYSSMYSNKRMREEGAEWRSGGSRGQGFRIAGNDLRLKLIRKYRQHHFGGAFYERRKKNVERLPKDIRPSQNLNKHPRRLGPNSIDNLSRNTHNGITDGLHIYPLQNMDGQRGFAEMPQIIPTASAQANLFSSNGDFYPSREAGLVPFTEKAITARPVTYVAPMSGIIQRRPQFDEALSTVAAFLNSLGLGKYAFSFRDEEVDMTALRQMGDRDLKELGIPMGPRKKLLLALATRSRWHLSHVRL